MGTWTLESVNGETSNHDTSELYGTNVKVTFRLRYRPSTFGKFVETPKLDWHEKFMMKEHNAGEWWQFEDNMYEHNPCSNTLKIWPGRYVYAYKSAMGRPDGSVKGSVTLLTANNAPVAKTALKQNLNDPAQQADAVRSYLKSSGGILVITVHDIPSINKPKDGARHKERLLKFDCGVIGGGPRWKGDQYLDVDGAKQPAAWQRAFAPVYGAFDTNGLKQTPPPPQVSGKRPPTFVSGECW